MPFQKILSDLVSKVEGAEGAIFLDGDGEAVQWHAKGDAERLRLRAAYIAVLVKSCRAASNDLALGNLRHLLIEYDGARLLVEQIDASYFIVLELNSSANLGQALHYIQPAVASIRREAAA